MSYSKPSRRFFNHALLVGGFALGAFGALGEASAQSTSAEGVAQPVVVEVLHPGLAPRAMPSGRYIFVADKPAMKRRSPLMMGLGITSLSVGALGVVSGAYLYVASGFELGCSSTFNIGTGGDGSCVNEAERDTSKAIMAMGALGVVAGIPLTIIGAQKVKVKEDQPAKASLVPEVRVRGAGGSMRWTF